MREHSPGPRLRPGMSYTRPAFKYDALRGARVTAPTGNLVHFRLRQRATWWRLFLGIGVVFLLFLIIKVPQWQAASWKGLMEHKDLGKLENDARTTLVQAAVGTVVLIGLYFTARTLQTPQQGQITDRFTKAITQLGEAGAEKLAIRLGGIYALERIARDSERDHWPIMEILTAYIREHAPWKNAGQCETGSVLKVEMD